MFKEFKGYIVGSVIGAIILIFLIALFFTVATKVKKVENCFHIESLFIMDAVSFRKSEGDVFSFIGKGTRDGTNSILTVYPRGGDELSMIGLIVTERGTCFKNQVELAYKIETYTSPLKGSSDVIR